MKIGVIGAGTVGRAIARCYMEWGEVLIHDALSERSMHAFNEVTCSARCDVVFVCVPEAEVEGVIKRASNRSAHLVIKSTVPIGTTRRLREQYKMVNLVHSPEFLTERCALVDAQTPARNIIGGHACECAAKLSGLYQRRFPGVPLLLMSSDESEAVKLIINSFFAVKVSFFNEANALAEKLGLNWDTVMGGVLSDGRIAHSHTRVPGHDGRYGFGGKCLVKDAEQLAKSLEENLLQSSVVEAALERNLVDRERIV